VKEDTKPVFMMFVAIFRIGILFIEQTSRMKWSSKELTYNPVASRFTGQFVCW
jgi:hypothetical protein